MGQASAALPVTYAERAIAYAEAVTLGDVPACTLTEFACQRFLDDLARPDWRWVFDPERAERVCGFKELMPHIKGRWPKGDGRLTLEDWQVFVDANVFGWVDRETRRRRFTTAYIEVPRKNGKSTWTAGTGLYMVTDDDEPGAEVYSAATTRDQARIIFGMCRTMAKRSPGMCREYGLHVGAHRLSVEATASWLEALSSDAHSLDGLNPHLAMIDELHAHKNRAVWDVLESALGARAQPLLWAITTAGHDRTGICYEVRGYVEKILNGTVVDDRVFGIIYTIDKDDDWTDETVWAKANPNLGVSVNVEDMRRMARKAQEQPSALNNFLTKRLNVWVSASTAWMDVRRWHARANPELYLEDFAGRRAFIGVDLASKVDLAAAAIWLPPVDDDEPWRLFTRFWLPEARLEDWPVAAAQGWERDGWLTTTPGDTTDFDYIDREVRDLCAQLDVGAIGYDPWQAAALANKWVEDRLPAVEVPARVAHFSEPMKELERMVFAGDIEHDGDPVMAWCVSNVVARHDANDNIYPRKERAAEKIDGVVAAIIGLNRALVDPGPRCSVYETRGIVSI